jgi:hypothetical protein
MTEWKDCKLGDLLTFEYGKFSKGYHDTQSGFPVYGTNGQIGYTQNALCPDPGIVIGRKGAYRGVHFIVVKSDWVWCQRHTTLGHFDRIFGPETFLFQVIGPG